MLTSEQFSALAEKYIDMVYRIALNSLGSFSDAEDVTQNVFEKLWKEKKDFASEDHVKHWLVRVALNESRNLTRTKWWRMESIENYASLPALPDPVHSDLFRAVMDLPAKYRIPVYLYHYEGYSTEEVAALMKIPRGSVCTRLKRGRELLKKHLMEVDENV